MDDRWSKQDDAIRGSITALDTVGRIVRLWSNGLGGWVARKPIDLVSETKAYKGDLHSFYLNMKQWATFKTRYKMQWRKCRFNAANQSAVTKERGIYVFTLELTPSKLPGHGYILYVGITGDTSKGTLYSRYEQYLAEPKKQRGRPLVAAALTDWAGHLFFNYVPLPDAAVDLRRLEKALITALVPPLNTADIQGTIKRAKGAAF